MSKKFLFILQHVPGSVRRLYQATNSTLSGNDENGFILAQSFLDPCGGLINFVLYVAIDPVLPGEWHEFLKAVYTEYFKGSILTDENDMEVGMSTKKISELSSGISDHTDVISNNDDSPMNPMMKDTHESSKSEISGN